MRILVTGADGLLGSNLVRVLLDRGHEVRALVQKGRQTITLDGLEIDRVEGDILVPESLKKAAEGVEGIFHVAAHTGIWPSRQEIINRVNIEGTQNMLDLAQRIGVKKMVYVGTANTFSFGSKEHPGVEDTPYKGDRYGLDYMDSKYKAHQLVINAFKNGLDVTIVNPTFMLGAYDSAPSSGAMVLAVYQQKVPGFAPGGRNYICVKDAAVGIANALEMGKAGESYIIGNRNMSYREAFTMMANTLGVKAPRVAFPKWVIMIYGAFGSFLAKLSGKAPTVSLPMAKISCDTHYFSAEKAVRELKLPQSPIEEGIRECLEWMKDNNIGGL
jgi:dihydroflavonol-4-reductase